MKITICKHMPTRQFDINSEEDVNNMREFYISKKNTTINEIRRLEDKLSGLKLSIELIDKGKINQAMVNEYLR